MVVGKCARSGHRAEAIKEEVGNKELDNSSSNNGHRKQNNNSHNNKGLVNLTGKLELVKDLVVATGGTKVLELQEIKASPKARKAKTRIPKARPKAKVKARETCNAFDVASLGILRQSARTPCFWSPKRSQ